MEQKSVFLFLYAQPLLVLSPSCDEYLVQLVINPGMLLCNNVSTCNLCNYFLKVNIHVIYFLRLVCVSRILDCMLCFLEDLSFTLICCGENPCICHISCCWLLNFHATCIHLLRQLYMLPYCTDPRTQGSWQGMTKPVTQGSWQGMTKPVSQGSWQGMTKPVSQGSWQGVTKPVTQGSWQGMTKPVTQGSWQGMTKPVTQGSWQGMTKPVSQGSWQGMTKPVTQGSCQGMTKPVSQGKRGLNSGLLLSRHNWLTVKANTTWTWAGRRKPVCRKINYNSKHTNLLSMVSCQRQVIFTDTKAFWSSKTINTMPLTITSNITVDSFKNTVPGPH